MARVLLAAWPYTGHIHPNIALAEALRARGHRVAFYTGALARPVVESEGFTYLPFKRVAQRIARIMGMPDAESANAADSPLLYERLTEYYTFAVGRDALLRARRMKAMYRDWILGTVPEQMEDLQDILAAWHPDVIVCDPFMWGPILVLHEFRSVPVAVFSFFAGCLLPGPDVPPFALGLPRPRARWARGLVRLLQMGKDVVFADLRREANRLRRAYGLAPSSASIMAFGGGMPLYLVASVPEFDYERRDLPASVRYVGACLWDRPRHAPPPAWLRQLSPDSLVVYVTEGTAQVGAPTLLRAACQGLAHMPAQVIMTTGSRRDPQTLDLGPRAPNIWVKKWVPHSQLFPRAAAVVTHGGSGTVLSALHAGLPLVVVPMQWDHFENAQRVTDAGAGLRLSLQQCTPEQLRRAVDRVLREASFNQNARRLAAALQRRAGANGAAALVENLCPAAP